MKILIYGAEVIGCKLAHMLCTKNDITLANVQVNYILCDSVGAKSIMPRYTIGDNSKLMLNLQTVTEELGN